MSDSEEKQRQKAPPYIDDDRLIINTRLSEIQSEQKREKEYQHSHDRKQLRFNKWLTIFSALLFLTSAVSDILIWRYVGLTKQSADAAKTAAETGYAQLFLAKRQTDFGMKSASDSLKTAIDNFHLEQRAWVGPGEVDMVPSEIKANQPISVSVWLVNTGKTRAIIESSLAVGAFHRFPDPAIYPNGIPGKSVLLPGSKVSVQIPVHQFEQSTVAGIMNETYTYYIYGRVRYTDVFSQSHTTTFCYRYKPSEKRTVGCREYQYAD
jgi:hypothetical protein